MNPTLNETADAAAITLPHDLTPWGMFLAADIVVQSIMIGLAIASVVTWTVFLAKRIEIVRARRGASDAYAILARALILAEAGGNTVRMSPDVSAMIAAAVDEVRQSSELSSDGIKERAASRLEQIEIAARRRVQRGVGILATIGSTAPFVGLLGTVWGIMNSFIGISKAQTTNLAIVAPGIAEALLATALGLVAAIPAVVIYNLFSRWIANYRAQLGDSSAQVRRLLSRELDRPREAVRMAAQ